MPGPACALLLLLLVGCARDPEGRPAWRADYDGPAHGVDGALALSVSPDGSRVYVAGLATAIGAGKDYVVLAHEAETGRRLWAATYDGPGHADDEATAIDVAPDGGSVFVAGRSRGPAGDDFATLALDAGTGRRRWEARLDAAGGLDDAVALAASVDGSGLFVTGTSQDGRGDTGFLTVAYNPSTGTERWRTRYDGAPEGGDSARALAIDGTGERVFVAGISGEPQGGSSYGVVAYDAATGREIWRARDHDATGSDHTPRDLAVSSAGKRVLVTGSSSNAAGSRDFGTVAFEAADGRRAWAARFDGTAAATDEAFRIGLAPSGTQAFVVGRTETGQGSADLALIAYDADTGAQQWMARFEGLDETDEAPRGLAVSRDARRVYVTGSSSAARATGGEARFQSDWVTLAYEAGSGALQWVETETGPGLAMALGMAPDGSRVYVAGNVWAGAASTNVHVVAYRVD